MAGPKKPVASEEPVLRVPRHQFEVQLEERIADGRALVATPPHDLVTLKEVQERFYTWEDYNYRLLSRAFTTGDPASEYRGVSFGGPSPSTPLHTQIGWFVEDVGKSVRRLESLKLQLELFDDPPVPTKDTTAPKSPVADEIFIVHGRDTRQREQVARFLELVTPLKPVILHEQPNAGRTIIEKFEAQASRAAFAVIVLTGDDEGRLSQATEWRRRARQNVVYEMGFFGGALGRSKVAVLYEPDVELPSDLDGLLYTVLDDAGAWKMGLAKELKAAGISVDFNKALTG